jgi:hypothetical protein
MNHHNYFKINESFLKDHHKLKKEASGVIIDNSIFESYKIISQPRSTQLKYKVKKRSSLFRYF